jgi:hypothetical protein
MRRTPVSSRCGFGLAACLAAFACLSLGAHPARAEPIHLFNTGVDDFNRPLQGGAVDAHYQLMFSADPGNGGPATYVVNSTSSAFPFNGWWMANSPQSQWIAPNADQNTSVAGNYVYRYTFNLSALELASLVIQGRWSSDNEGLGILVNGRLVVPPTGDPFAFLSFHDFTLDQGFIDGLNTVDFVVHNDPNADAHNATGLRVEWEAHGPDPAPEPGTMVLFSLGALGLIGYARRRQRA